MRGSRSTSHRSGASYTAEQHSNCRSGRATLQRGAASAQIWAVCTQGRALSAPEILDSCSYASGRQSAHIRSDSQRCGVQHPGVNAPHEAAALTRSIQAPSYYGSTQWRTELLHCPSVGFPTKTQEGRAWYMAINSAAKAHMPATAFEAGPSNRTAILAAAFCTRARSHKLRRSRWQPVHMTMRS